MHKRENSYGFVSASGTLPGVALRLEAARL